METLCHWCPWEGFVSIHSAVRQCIWAARILDGFCHLGSSSAAWKEGKFDSIQQQGVARYRQALWYAKGEQVRGSSQRLRQWHWY